MDTKKTRAGLAPAMQLNSLVKAKFGVAYVVSHEEEVVLNTLTAIAATRKLRVYVWSIARGLVELHRQPEIEELWVEKERTTEEKKKDPTPFRNPATVLQHVYEDVCNVDEDVPGAVWLLTDFHRFIEDPTCCRWLREIRQKASLAPQGHERLCAILAPILKLPAELDKEVPVIDWPLPDRQEVGQVLDLLSVQWPPEKRAKALEGTTREKVVEAALGLTMIEVEHALSRTYVTKGRWDVPLIYETKRAAIRKSGIVELVDADVSLADVGGLERLKVWAPRERKAFGEPARQKLIDMPKGALLIGVSGGGKSLVAKGIANEWGMPLVRVDFARMMGSLVGESESNWRTFVKTVEANAPCVALFDEMEKQLGGHGTDSSGVSTRLTGSLLTWMQERTAPVYIIGTVNDVDALPAPLLRRWDKIWFCDLPHDEERQEIFGIHLRRRGHELKPTAELIKATADFSGAEIETAVKEAAKVAFYEDRALTNADLLEAARTVVPVAKSMPEQTDRYRRLIKEGLATPASLPKAEKKRSKAGAHRTLDSDAGIEVIDATTASEEV